MKTELSSFTPEQIEAWLDGELASQEAAILDRLALEDSSLQQRRRAHEALRSAIASQLPAEPELPYADFFMHQLERRIEEEQLAAETQAEQQQQQSQAASSWKNWLPWTLSAGCAAALALVLSLPKASENQGSVTQVEDSAVLLSAYSPRAQIRAEVKQNQPVIVVLEGLPEYEGEVSGVGLRVSDLEANYHQQKNTPDWSLASQELY